MKTLLKQLPEQPGIYYMKNSLGTVIYVGKAKNLKARVSQYFQKRDHSPKIAEMVGHIAAFEYVTTDTELEALLLECKTIRELKPKYNRLLKNSKRYSYIGLSIHEAYPKLSKTTHQKQDGTLYFGPFTSEGSVDHTIQFIKDHFLIRKCSSALTKNSSGCLHFHLGTCLGPCRGKDDSQELYRSQVDQIIQFLYGKNSTPVKELRAKMKSAAGSLDFEKAAQYRDQLNGIRHVLNTQRLIRVSRYGRNIVAAERFGQGQLKLFLINGNKLLHTETTNPAGCSHNQLAERLRDLVTAWFRNPANSHIVELSQEDIDEAQIIYSYLRNKKNGIQSVHIPASRVANTDDDKILKLLTY